MIDELSRRGYDSDPVKAWKKSQVNFVFLQKYNYRLKFRRKIFSQRNYFQYLMIIFNVFPTRRSTLSRYVLCKVFACYNAWLGGRTELAVRKFFNSNLLFLRVGISLSFKKNFPTYMCCTKLWLYLIKKYNMLHTNMPFSKSFSS